MNVIRKESPSEKLVSGVPAISILWFNFLRAERIRLYIQHDFSDLWHGTPEQPVK